MNAKAIVNNLLEAEPEEYLETQHRVRDQQGMTAQYARYFSVDDNGQDLSFTSGSRSFDRVDGVWYETKRRRNPEHWNQPTYFFLAPGPGTLAFIAVKMPRTLNTRLWRIACGQLYKDATGKSWRSVSGGGNAVVDGLEASSWELRAAGKKPEPAYEIMADGTWKRVK